MPLEFTSAEKALLHSKGADADAQSYVARERLIRTAMKTEKGRMLLGAETVPFIRQTVDYQSIARKIFVVDTYEQGSREDYDKQPIVEAYVLGPNGDIIRYDVGRDTFSLYPFKVAVNPREDKLRYVRRRYAMLDQIQQKASQAIWITEDTKCFALLSAALPASHAITVSGGKLLKTHLSDAFAHVEHHGNMLRVATVLVDPKALGDIRNWDYSGWSDSTREEMETTGKVGRMWGADFYAVPLPGYDTATYGTVFCLAAPEYLGILLEYLPLDVEDDPMARYEQAFGFVYSEAIGLGVGNPNGAVKVSVAA
ncbi:MAG: hypothetical protein M1343_08425 [Chloroflexi bacterium]|nr:hypothetical protein [Chloroflexota bacterium]